MAKVDLSCFRLEGGGTNSHASLRVVLDALRQAGADGAAELRDLGVLESELLTGKARIPRGVYNAMWHRLVEVTGDPDSGLKLARDLPAGAMGVLEYAARNAPNVREGLRAIARFGRLLHDAGEYALTERTGGAVCGYRTPGAPRVSRAQIDWAFGYLLQSARRATGALIAPRRVTVTYAAPMAPSVVEAFYRCPVEYQSRENSMWLSDEVLDLPLAGADPKLAEVLSEAAAKALAELPAGNDLLARLEEDTRRQLLDGNVPKLNATARSMGLSSRSLQRALQAEGTQFQTVVAEVRLALAMERLREGSRPIGEIASELGYSEPSAFHRAFKRAFGTTPTRYRAEASAS